MFICQQCIKKVGAFAPSVSYGICEECHKKGDCADIKATIWNEWNKKETK